MRRFVIVGCSSLALVALVALVGLGSGTAHAQPADVGLGDLASFLTLFPEAATLPAGSGLAPGVRVSYESAGAATAGGASGVGVIQYDVVQVDAQRVRAYQHSYADGGAGVVPLASGPVVGLPAIGPFWINPVLLEGAESVASATLSVTRTQRTVAGQSLSVVRFESNSAGRTVWELDTVTGLLVFDSISSSSGAAQSTLLGARALAIPWAADRAPNWVRPGADVRYEGTDSTTVPAAGTVPMPVSLAIRVAQAGARWSTSTIDATIGGVNQGTSFGVTGSGQLLGATWLPVSALAAALPTEAVMLDVDPSTGATVFLQRGADGEIAIQEVTSASRTTWLYSPTLGVLDRLTQSVQLATALREADVGRVAGGSDLDALSREPPLPEDPTEPPPATPPPGGPPPPGTPPTPGTPPPPGADAGGAGGAGGGDGDGGCSAASGLSSSTLAIWLLAALILARRSRREASGR